MDLAIIATSALIQSAGLELRFSPFFFFTGNPDRYLSADFVLMLPCIYDVLCHLPWGSLDYISFRLTMYETTLQCDRGSRPSGKHTFIMVL